MQEIRNYYVHDVNVCPGEKIGVVAEGRGAGFRSGCRAADLGRGTNRAQLRTCGFAYRTSVALAPGSVPDESE
jgi:hypothetical protein